jgi:hypothetical protein
MKVKASEMNGSKHPPLWCVLNLLNEVLISYRSSQTSGPFIDVWLYFRGSVQADEHGDFCLKPAPYV